MDLGGTLFTAILFDLHGVLINHPYEAWVRRHAQGNKPLIKRLIDLVMAADAGQISLAQLRTEAGKPFDIPPDQVKAEVAAEVRVNQPLVKLITTQIWPSLFHVGILSNVNHQLMYEVLDACDLMGVFNFVLASSSVGLLKPDPEIYELTLMPLHAQPGQVIFVDDNELNVLAAQALGMCGIVYESVPQLTEALRAQHVLPAG